MANSFTIHQLCADLGRHLHQAILERFFDNGWVNLLVCDPQSGDFLRYERGGQWRLVGQGARRAA